MSLTFQARPDRRVRTAALRAAMRGRLTVIRCLGGFVFCLGVVLFALDLNLWNLLFYGTLGLLMGVVVPEVQVWLITRMRARVLDRPTTYTITADGFRAATDLTGTSARWAAVQEVTELDGLLLVRVDRLQFVGIPTAGLTAQQLGQLRTLAGLAVEVPAPREEPAPVPSTPVVRPPTP